MCSYLMLSDRSNNQHCCRGRWQLSKIRVECDHNHKEIDIWQSKIRVNLQNLIETPRKIPELKVEAQIFHNAILLITKSNHYWDQIKI